MPPKPTVESLHAAVLEAFKGYTPGWAKMGHREFDGRLEIFRYDNLNVILCFLFFFHFA